MHLLYQHLQYILHIDLDMCVWDDIFDIVYATYSSNDYIMDLV